MKTKARFKILENKLNELIFKSEEKDRLAKEKSEQEEQWKEEKEKHLLTKAIRTDENVTATSNQLDGKIGLATTLITAAITGVILLLCDSNTQKLYGEFFHWVVGFESILFLTLFILIFRVYLYPGRYQVDTNLSKYQEYCSLRTFKPSDLVSLELNTAIGNIEERQEPLVFVH
jgi:hypothetical protein